MIGAFPDNNSVLIMDNCRIHDKEFIIGAAKNVCGGFGALFIPAYSPKFAPIESAFSSVKTWIHSNRDYVYSVDAGTAIDTAIDSCLSAASCRAWIESIYLKAN